MRHAHPLISPADARMKKVRARNRRRAQDRGEERRAMLIGITCRAGDQMARITVIGLMPPKVSR
jgi:hypothetical protein